MTQPTIIGGRYEVLGRLGSGGMAVVYRARDTRLAREVALKVLRKEAVSAKDTTMFHREARAIAALRHFNIIQVYDFSGPEESPAYLVMELIDGLTLEALLDQRGPLPEGAMLLIGRAIASALEHSHERGVIHRDIKPANILLERTGRVLLTDFGIAKPFRDAKALGATVVARNTGLLGTPAFMAPEQIAEEPIGPAVDVFSLGSLLYYMVVGSSPFRANDDVVEILRRILDVEYTAPNVKRPDLSPDAVRLIEPCLRRDPTGRPSAGKMSQRCSRLVRRLELGDNQRALARFLDTGALPIADVTEVATGSHPALPRPHAARSTDAYEVEATTQPLSGPFRPPAVPLTPGRPAPRWGLVGLLGGVALLALGLGLAWALSPEAPTAGAVPQPAVLTPLTVVVPPAAPTTAPPAPAPAPAPSPSPSPSPSPQAASPTGPEPAPAPAANPPSDAAAPDEASTPAARPTKRKRPPRGDERVAPAAPGQIEVNVRPWGQITLDGVMIGNTPLVRVVPLPPGKHTITVSHPALGSQQQSFTLRPGERRVLSFDLQGK